MTLTATAVATGTPAPYVDVYADAFPADAASLTVWRTAGGREFRVRGMVGLDAGAGLATVQDFEAPFGVESSYRVQFFDVSGAVLGWSDPVTATLPGLPAGWAWFHNPLYPSSAVQVQMLSGAAAELSRGVDFETFRVPGRSVGLAVFGGARRGLERVVLDCLVSSFADADRLQALFGGYDDDTIPIVCVRTAPAMRLPPTLFAVVADPREIPVDNFNGGETVRYALAGDEVTPPPEAFVSALLDYADFTAFYTDYAAFSSAYPDYTAATRDYTIAGTA